MLRISIQRSKQFFIVIVGLALIPFSSAQELFTQEVTPTTMAYELRSVPAIDGEVLGDDAWSEVTPTGGFSQVRPDEGQPSTQKTEVFLGYTEESLYIVVVAYDTNPEGITFTDARRDSSLEDTDSFQVIIDGLLDRQSGFIFGTTPAGLEYDAQVVNEGAS